MTLSITVSDLLAITVRVAHTRCRITVSSVEPTDWESWHTIWKQAVAIERLCIEKLHKPGFALYLGK